MSTLPQSTTYAFSSSCQNRSPKVAPTSLYTPPSPPSSDSTPSPRSSLPSSPLANLSHEEHHDPWTDLGSQLRQRAQTQPDMEGSLPGLDASWRDDSDGPVKYGESSTIRHRYMPSSGSTATAWEPPIRLTRSGPLQPDLSVADLASTSRSAQPDAGPEGHQQLVPVAIPVAVVDASLARRPLNVAVWGNVTATSVGRDKVLKCVQYSLRTYLYILSLIARVRPLSRWFAANQKRMKLATSGLSLTRKCLLLTNFLHPLSDLLSPEPMSARTMLLHLIDLMSGLSDDIYCLGRLGIVSKRTGKKAEDWSNRFWLLTTLMGLYKLHVRTLPPLRRRRESPALDAVDRKVAEKELAEVHWTRRKLLADLVFVSYDIFAVQWFAEPVQCLAGLTAAFISTRKLYDKHWQANLASLGK